MALTPSVRHDLAALKHTRSLADVVSAAGVQLRPSGAERLVGCCPFHEDHVPSFMVDQRDQHFHCFACGAHGDVIAFVMRHDQLDFRQALERLAGAPNAAPGRRQQAPSLVRRERRWDRLTVEEQLLMNTAAAAFQERLWREPMALSYLRQRCLPEWLIRSAGLGYADGHTLASALRRPRDRQLAQELGLLLPLDRDRLPKRILVPEVRAGNCLWFIGRTLEDEPGGLKYLAMGGERPVLGLERAAGQRQVFLAEGVFDYLSALAWRLPAWSPCGVYLPDDRLGFLASSDVVYGVFDGDAAGRSAAVRFGGLLGDRWRPLWLPDGCDWSDLACRRGGRAEFSRLLAAARRPGAQHSWTVKGERS